MKTIKFSERSFWFKYWNFISFSPFKWERPEDTCSLKRQLILHTFIAIATLPLFLLFQLVRWIFPLPSFNTKDWVAVLVLLQVFIAGFSTVMMDSLSISYTLSYLIILGGSILGILGIILLAFIIVGIGEGIIKYNRSRNSYGKPKKIKAPSIVKVIYRNWKEKLCSKIEYVN